MSSPEPPNELTTGVSLGDWISQQCWCFSGEVCSETYSASQNEALVIVPLAGATLSALGSVFIIASYFVLVPLRTFPQRLVLFLSLADLLTSVSYFVGVSNVDGHGTCNASPRCDLAAFANFSGGLASAAWTVVIAFNCHAAGVLLCCGISRAFGPSCWRCH